MVRSVASIFAGAIAWMAGFLVLVSLLALAWPEYALSARTWHNERLFTFTTPMACLMLLFWVLAAVGAGWVAMRIAKRRQAVWVLAGLIEIYIVAIHIVLAWPTFPWWYNLGVVIPAVPVILFGARLGAAR